MNSGRITPHIIWQTSYLLLESITPLLGAILLTYLLAKGENPQNFSFWYYQRHRPFFESFGLLVLCFLAWTLFDKIACRILDIFPRVFGFNNVDRNLTDDILFFSRNNPNNPRFNSIRFSELVAVEKLAVVITIACWIFIAGMVLVPNILAIPIGLVNTVILRQQYGEDVFSYCRNGILPSTPPSAKSDSDIKLVFFWTKSVEGHPLWGAQFPEPFNQLVPSDMRALNRSEITHIVCLEEQESKKVAAKYTGGSTCTQYQTNIAVETYDLRLGTQLMSRTFSGSVPKERCPQVTQGSLSHYGAPPNAEDIVSWVLAEATSDQR